jgi:hypothetical protein
MDSIFEISPFLDSSSELEGLLIKPIGRSMGNKPEEKQMELFSIPTI